jgi:hypothetical protein
VRRPRPDDVDNYFHLQNEPRVLPAGPNVSAEEYKERVSAVRNDLAILITEPKGRFAGRCGILRGLGRF